ncbi:MAG: hypothetical protein K2P30_10760, partial [Lachnospiraceae bacterium]|nr:hypothetical protein [Lachnospiraceae bacterium]
MKVRNMSIFMGDDARRERQSNIGAEQNNKNRKSIFAGNLNKKPDMIAQKKQVAQQQAMQIVRDAWDGDRKVDEGIAESKGRIEEYKKARNDANEELKQFKENRLAAGLSEVPEEGTPEAAELKRIEAAIESANAGIRGENAVIRETRLEKLKHDPMVKASQSADEVMEAASKEIVGMLIQEAKEHMDEEMEEKKEAAEEKAEKEKEEEEKLEKIREEKKEKEEFAESVAESTELVLEADSSMDEIQKEIRKVMEEMKLIEEDIEGATVDASM